MTKLGMTVLSSSAMAAVVAGCSSGTYGTGVRASMQTNSVAWTLRP